MILIAKRYLITRQSKFLGVIENDGAVSKSSLDFARIKLFFPVETKVFFPMGGISRVAHGTQKLIKAKQKILSSVGIESDV